MSVFEDDEDKYKKYMRQKRQTALREQEFDNLILFVFFAFVTITALCYCYYRGFEDARNLIDAVEFDCNCGVNTRRNTSMIRKILFRQKV